MRSLALWPRAASCTGEPARRGSERLGSARAAPSRSAPKRRQEPARTCAAEPSAPRSGPRLAGNAPRPAPSGDLQRLLASMQSSWGARRLLPGPPVREHARPRPQGRPASLPRERGRDLLEDTAMLLRGPPASFTVTHRCV